MQFKNSQQLFAYTALTRVPIVHSALDIFGGTPVKFTDCVAWNNQE